MDRVGEMNTEDAATDRCMFLSGLREEFPAVLCGCGGAVASTAAWIACSQYTGGSFVNAGIMLALTGVGLICFGIALVILRRRCSAKTLESSRALTCLRIASEGAEIGFWDRDLRGGTLIWDQAMHRIYGTDPHQDQPTCELWAGLVHPEDIADTADLFDRTIDGIEKFETTFRIVTPAGETRTVRTAATVLRDRDGTGIRIVGATWDVSPLAEATTELSNTATRLSLAMRSAKIGLWDLDLTTDRVEYDETLHTLFGYDTGELNGPISDHHDRCHPDDLTPMLTDCINYPHHHCGSFCKDYRLRTKGGDWVWVHDAGEVVERDALGTPTRMVGVRMLIDEQKRTGDALRSVVALKHSDEGHGLLSEIARSMADSFDLMFVGVFQNRDGAEQPTADLVGGWYRGAEAEPVSYEIHGTPCEIAGAEGYHFVSRGVQSAFPDDEMLVEFGAESYAGVQIINSRGEPIGILNVTHDLQLRDDIDFESVLRLLAARAAVEIERNEIENQLRDAKAEAERVSAFKSEFLANVSHEIRTPIAAMIGYADLLTESRASEHQLISDYSNTISRNGNHLLTLVNDLLDTSKIEAGQMRIEWIPVSPVELIRDVDALFRPRMEEKGLSFEIVCGSPIPASITTDPARLRQILVNLLSNAAKFTQTGGVAIRIVYEENPGVIRFSVSDTGIGIAPEDMNKLFEPFVQAEASTTRRFGGTGLGLSISKHLARLLGGDLKATSAPVRGSEFKVTISAQAAPDAPMLTAEEFVERCGQRALPANAASGPDRPPLQHMRVLLVEDSIDNRRLIRFHIERLGGTVTLAEHGKEGLSILSSGESFELIVTDIQMPVMDGYEFVKALRKQGFSTPVIALTAHATTDDELRCLEAGCDVYETKPISRDRLVAASFRAIRNARRQRAA